VGNCANWDLRETEVWVDAGWLTKAFMWVSIPAFVVGEAVVSVLGRVGVNEVWSFMIAMPPLLLVWYSFVGLMVDRRINK
jgi:hypothetical protein